MKLRDVEEVLGDPRRLWPKRNRADDHQLRSLLRIQRRSAGYGGARPLPRRRGIACQVIYPSLGIIWEGEVDDPALADALCRAYNRWAFDLVANHRDRLYPAAHISMRDAAMAVKEMERVAKLGCRIVFVAAMPIKGKSFGHPDFDPIGRRAKPGSRGRPARCLASPLYRQRFLPRSEAGPDVLHHEHPARSAEALTTMVVDGVFERFPRLRVAPSRRWRDGSANGSSESIIATSTWATPRK